MAELFDKGRSTITEHVLNVFKEGELDEKVVCREFRRTTKHGAIKGKTQEISVKQYNLDVIISVGYRIKSLRRYSFSPVGNRKTSKSTLSKALPWTMRDSERIRRGKLLERGSLIGFATFAAVRKSCIVKCSICMQPVKIMIQSPPNQ